MSTSHKLKEAPSKHVHHRRIGSKRPSAKMQQKVHGAVRFYQHERDILGKQEQVEHLPSSWLASFKQLGTSITQWLLKWAKPPTFPLSQIEREEQKNIEELKRLPLETKQTMMRAFIKFLSRKNRIYKEGIFRLSGSTSKKRALLQSLVKEMPFVISDEMGAYEVASAFKEFIGTCGVFDEEATRLFLEAGQEQDVNRLKQVVDLLTKEKKALLQSLLAFLERVAEKQEFNDMNAEDLAICIASRLVQLDASTDILEDISKANFATKLLIEEQNELFEG